MKTLQELTLLDKFLFDEVIEDKETYEALLRIILGDEELNLLTEAQSEKELRTAPWLRSIRVDVFAMDDKSTIYNTEMQKEWRADLIKRTRYYQALIDSSLLEPGEINFNNIKNTTIIMIMPFDLFRMGKYIYTFEEICREYPDLKLEDGAKRIFINTHGKNNDEVSPEFIALMKFIEYNESEEYKQSSPNLDRIINRVSQVKASEEVGVKYMQRWEEEALIRNEGKEEGREEGREEGKIETKVIDIKNLMENMKLTAEQAMIALGIDKNEFSKYLPML
ncbi:MAG: Rpn family recombination-promoting nuclease/putative transposase [Pseudobutyrivibrio sp.]|uniref:Rpn family recombination-promoting nuclease/putative transposase n=1 Tax=Pseudobutyrivibrio sp. TaxID=2014367 RepID=UPI0025FE288D|nr:Rpn family recombination-promoting nuclease/putative transposase [Pseudobutyrivibrio sp.]MBQ8489644.1 Rpn family recombination-promoting nuclease/putative transposase [Pseudobutyrivibrio sp.]